MVDVKYLDFSWQRNFFEEMRYLQTILIIMKAESASYMIFHRQVRFDSFVIQE
jgi:hypothetical protein